MRKQTLTFRQALLPGSFRLAWRTGATQPGSSDRPGTVTLIANYIPLQEPAGGPNFYECGDDVRYEIHVGNSGDGAADISYQFRFAAKLTITSSFLCTTGPTCPAMTAL